MSRTTLDTKELKVLEVQGAGPLEDSGGVYGWEEVKKAFAARNPSRAQVERRRWAAEMTSLGDSYNPTVAPTVASLNARGFDAWMDGHTFGSDDSLSDLDDDVIDPGVPRYELMLRHHAKLLMDFIQIPSTWLSKDAPASSHDLQRHIWSTRPRRPGTASVQNAQLGHTSA